MLAWDTRIDGNRDVGATAVFINLDVTYSNNLSYNSHKKLIKIEMSGRGGRGKHKGKFIHTHNQEFHKNYPLLLSEQVGLPIRVLTQQNKQIVYRGLWRSVGHTYLGTAETNNKLTYKFQLERFV